MSARHTTPEVACWACQLVQSALPATATLIRINRVLAWGLVVSPPAQIALQVNFWRGLLFDLVLVLVHGGLSLMLFGLPRSPRARKGIAEGEPPSVPPPSSTARALLLIGGVSPKPAGPRNALLLSGYRVLLALGYMLVIATMLSLGGFQQPSSWIVNALFWTGLYVMARLPFSVLGHLYLASDLAIRRTGPRYYSQSLALLVVAAFVATSMFNMLK